MTTPLDDLRKLEKASHALSLAGMHKEAAVEMLKAKRLYSEISGYPMEPHVAKYWKECQSAEDK